MEMYLPHPIYHPGSGTQGPHKDSGRLLWRHTEQGRGCRMGQGSKGGIESCVPHSSAAGAQLKHRCKVKGHQCVFNSTSPFPLASISCPPWSSRQVYQFTPKCSRITKVERVLVSLILDPDMSALHPGTHLQGCHG